MRRVSLCSFWLMLLALPATLILSGCGNSSGAPASFPVGSVSKTQNPIVAEYDVTASQAGTTAWVEFGTDTTYGRKTSVTPASSNPYQTIAVLVAGMRQNTTYHMRAHASWSGGTWVDQDRTFKTAALPTITGTNTPLVYPSIKVTVPNPSQAPTYGVELFNLVGGGNQMRAFVTDLQGNIIWYYDPGPNAGSPVPMKLMPNGHFLLNVGDLREVDLTGRMVRDIQYTQINQSLKANGYDFSIIGFHHDVAILPNGHWITLANVTKDYTNLPGFPGVTSVLGDALIDIDPNGNVAWAWNTFDHLDVNRHPLGLPNFQGLGADWTHSNAILYMSDGNLLLSMRNQCWIIKIDYQNGSGAGDILWTLGEGGDFDLQGNNPSDWFYAQHFPNIISDNGAQTTLAVWDNGDNRLDSNNQPCPIDTPCYSRATIFQVDQNAKYASLQWQDLPGNYSFWGGSISELPNGDVDFDQTTPFGSSTESVIMEVTQTDNPQTVWELDLKGENAYRGYRIPSLYPGVTWQ